MSSIVISSGHGKYVRGAEGVLDEVNEARRVVEAVAGDLDRLGVDVIVFHDNESRSQDENLEAIVSFHNAQTRDLDVSVHFNAYLSQGETTDDPKGCEVWHATQPELAAAVSAAMAEALDLPDRGAKENGLYFLNNTEEPAILLEVCFVDSTTDAEHYNANFQGLCAAIAAALVGDDDDDDERPEKPQPPERPERPERPARPERPPDEADKQMPPTISAGDYGSAVRMVQECLRVSPIDGDFGPKTEDAVEAFQRSELLEPVDGEVGPDTWAALSKEYRLPDYPPAMLPPLAAETIQDIEDAAASSDVADLLWEDRGVAPIGYVQGMALAYATVVRKYERGDGAAYEMAKADTGNDDVDALALYRSEFQKHGMDNSRPGRRTLRHVFVFLLGLGMRESSGEHCCGRDQSAENVEAETCEAGLFQTSYNYHVCATDADWIFDEYRHALSGTEPQCQLAAFEREVDCSPSDWENYGSGVGADFQELTKVCPAFAVESAAIGIRNLRQHWGPIGRMEVQIAEEANRMLAEVDKILEVAEVA
jgi:hypothetical protein